MSAKPVPAVDVAQPMPAECGAAVNGRDAADECSKHWGEKAGFPPAPSQALAWSITVEKQTPSPIPLSFLLNLAKEAGDLHG